VSEVVQEGADSAAEELGDEAEARPLDTFDVLGVAEDEYAYASLITWLLDPEGEHGLGGVLQEQLARFLEALGIDWQPGEVYDGRVRVNEDNCGIVLKGAGNKGLVIVLRLFAGGEVRGLEGVRAAGVPVVGLAYGPSAFPSTAELPVWRLQGLAQALRSVPNGRFSQLLAELRRRLNQGRGTLASSRLSAVETFLRSQLKEGTDVDRTRVEGIDAEMLLSDDLSRAYVLGQVVGEGGQGTVYTVVIQGEQFFPGFANPVAEAVMKVAHGGHEANLEREREVMDMGDPGVVRKLDAGATAAGTPYLILERLHRLPSERLSLEVGDPLRIASAVDIFANLLQTLHELHFRRDEPLVLCDIKPDNVLLRMPGHCELSDDEFEAFLCEHSYEPVFVDVACAQDVHRLEEKDGKLGEMIGTPAYLPPESIPELDGDHITMGTYSRKTDVYSLTLTFYVLLTGKRPYEHDANLQGLSGREFLLQLFTLKRREGALPYDELAIEHAVGVSDKDLVLELLNAGLAADPDERPSAQALLKQVEQAFGLEPHRTRPERYVYDGPVALRQRQTRVELG